MNKIYWAWLFLVLFLCAQIPNAQTAYGQNRSSQERMPVARSWTPQIPAEAVNPATVFEADRDGWIKLPDSTYGMYTSDGVSTELIMPNSRGDSYVRIPIEKKFKPSDAYLDAQELRLKVRELTSQLLETWPFSGVKDIVAYVTTFTPQDDLTLATPFGQTLRDAFIYEFNNRGFPVRDFSARDYILNEDGFGYGVSNNTYTTPVLSKNSAMVTGTFYRDKEYLFMNVRLVRGYDGMVLRTAQTIFTVTPLIARMTDNSYRAAPPLLSSGGLPIVAGKTVK